MDESIPRQMVADILDTVKSQDADCMGLICPTCFDEFDLGQIMLGRKLGREFNVPIVYYFQLLGIAQGLGPKDVGLDMHKVKFERISEFTTA
jgi:heterodisulfide reductase subunit B